MHFIDKAMCSRVCPSYDEFVKKCQDLEKMTISDVFALQLMQVIASSYLLKILSLSEPDFVLLC